MTVTTSTTAPRTSVPPADHIDAAEFRTLLDTRPDTRVIDVRTPGEFAAGHIPGSYNVPLDALGEHGRELAALDHPVVLVCQSGGRAQQAHGELHGQGRTNLHILRGGMSSWSVAGGDTASTTSDTWALERQIRLVAGGLTLAGILVSTVAPRAKYLAGAIGAGLTFSALTNTCAMGNVLSRLPYNQAASCDIEATLAAMNDQRTSTGDRS